MTKFDRKFNVDAVEKALGESVWLQDLLVHWCPAGELRGGGKGSTQPDKDYLRLAVRDGYLNFYRYGQSVARVNVVHGKPQAEVHNKYVYGDQGSGQGYVKITDGTFKNHDGTRGTFRYGIVHDWIQIAGGHAGKEKSFVDGLVANNPGVIDLEAGLPWDPDIWKERSAKRIDLVALEGFGNGYRLVFWEAKLVTNSEARSRTVPQVFEQLKNYTCWLAKHNDEVRDAYQRACQVLVRLHSIAKSRYPNICDLGRAIVAVARQDASQLGLDTRPRLVIDDANKNAAFTEHGHLDRLQAEGYQVHVVRCAENMTL